MAAAQAWGANLTTDGRTERVPALQVSGTLFDVLGAAPLVGRTIAETDASGDATRGRARPPAVGPPLRRRCRRGRALGRHQRRVVSRDRRHASRVSASRRSGKRRPRPGFRCRWPIAPTIGAADRCASSRASRDGVSLDQARAELTAVNDRLARDVARHQYRAHHRRDAAPGEGGRAGPPAAAGGVRPGRRAAAGRLGQPRDAGRRRG